MELLTDLAQYGIVGVCIALIGALIYIVKGFLKIVGNHIDHNTEATKCNTEIMSGLKTLIEERIPKK